MQCPHDSQCPLLLDPEKAPKNPCHFAQRVQLSLGEVVGVATYTHIICLYAACLNEAQVQSFTLTMCPVVATYPGLAFDVLLAYKHSEEARSS